MKKTVIQTHPGEFHFVGPRLTSLLRPPRVGDSRAGALKTCPGVTTSVRLVGGSSASAYLARDPLKDALHLPTEMCLVGWCVFARLTKLCEELYESMATLFEFSSSFVCFFMHLKKKRQKQKKTAAF